MLNRSCSDQTIKDFKNFLNSTPKNINNQIKKRKDVKINFKDIIYYSSLLISNGYSFDSVNSYLKIKNILDVSQVALIKRKNNLNSEYFNDLNNNLLGYIYSDDDKKILAMDGTYIVILLSLSKENIKVSRNGNYCIALISTIMDIEKEIPINYSLFKNLNEREALIYQLKYLNPGDTLIMDRGYFSNEILMLLINNNINCIFRLKKNLNILGELINIEEENEITIDVLNDKNTIKFRIIKYYIENKYYYLGTTIYNKDISYFKYLYWKRWKIEINFRYSKYNLSLKTLKSKTFNGIKQDVLIIHFIFIICSSFQYLLQKEIKTNYKINTTLCLKIFINEVLYLFLYKSSTDKLINEILRILNIVKESPILIQTNRVYKRVKKRPSTKWCQYGNKYLNNK
jgi:hypothetical protein